MDLASLAALRAEGALLETLAARDLSAANTLPLLSELRKAYPPALALPRWNRPPNGSKPARSSAALRSSS
ncbi:MAG: hypothetical protein HC915_04845 [Anaerolineae bacterium]|nr:hypothetical protein [Anaerolineae bacterium]